MPGFSSQFGVALLLVLTSNACAHATSGQQDASAILGVWRGTSICTNREVAPACKDEQIIYTFRPLSGGLAGKVVLKAEKIVDGKIIPMNELEGLYDPANGTWSAEIQSARFHGLWSYVISGLSLTGTLADLPSKAIIRSVSARKE
jgi:hypothetical protein